MPNCTDLVCPLLLLVGHGLTEPRLIELRSDLRLHCRRIYGDIFINDAKQARNPKWRECLTEGKLVGITLTWSQFEIALLVLMRGVDQYEACYLLWVSKGVEAHNYSSNG